MAIRGIGDAYAFQRLLWLLVGTVVVPTALLALYGVVAIRNERHAMGERVRMERVERIQWAHALSMEQLEQASIEVGQALPRCVPDGPCEVDHPLVRELLTWRSDDAPPPELSAVDLPGQGVSVWARSSDGKPVHTGSHGDTRYAWWPDLTSLAQTVEAATSGRWPRSAAVILEAQQGVSPLETFERWHSYRPVLPLSPPLQDYHLSIGPDDPQDRAFSKTTTLSGMGLVALVLIVLSGTVITLRSALREIRLSRLQTDFVSNVSHELKTPLTSISMFVETLRSGRLDDPERVEECLDLLASETDRLSRRIERVLSWARMEAGRRVYEVEPVDAEEIISEVLAAFRSQRLGEADPTEDIAVDVDVDIEPMMVDRDAIVEALLNLVSNAVKYTPQPRKIRISTEQKRGWVGLTVTDNGPGIDPREKRRIFEKFYQADTLLSRSVEGSGLGLAIVRAVVQAHAGSVSLETELGRGSRFTLWLPAAG